MSDIMAEAYDAYVEAAELLGLISDIRSHSLAKIFKRRADQVLFLEMKTKRTSWTF